ncbi:MAG: PRC-barrel domain-containing protein [Candidatus Nanopusillus sp.]|jgi:sporulation protein YlmC with PRC-barrel domain|nr:PRC-barrel domain-containing protein [Candidatus Nanopusillus sp.]
MALNVRKISETTRSKVYTEDGYFLGEVEDAIISDNKIYGWKIKVLDPDLSRRGIKGLIVPHQLIKAMGQIWIISKAVYSVKSSTEKEEKSSKETPNIETQSKIEIEKVE